MINIFLWSYPVFLLYKVAGENNISLSPLRNLDLQINRWEIQTQRSVKYLTREWNDLYLDYYPADRKWNKQWKPLVYIHWGGFTGWNRSEEPMWIDFFTSQWYDVFDVWYTLATNKNPTWNIAGREIQTALSWISENSKTYNIDISELIVVGSSAGWTLALQAVYGWRDKFPPYWEYDIQKVKKIITLFPAVDLKTLWDLDTTFYGIKSRDVEYIWGTPYEYPERYDRINTLKLVSSESPETLIIHWASDTLIPIDTVTVLKQRLHTQWIENTFVSIPYAQHGFTYFSWSFGSQMSRGIIENFLKN